MPLPIIPLTKFLEDFPAAIIVTDKDSNILLVNSAFTRLTGLGKNEIPQALLGAQNNQTSFKSELNTPKDQVLSLHVSRSPVTLDDDSTGMVYLFTDESQLGIVTKELSQINEEFEQFAYAASHDMQEPLRMIASYIQLIERKLQQGDTKDTPEFMNYVLDGVARMQMLISDLLLISRINRKGSDFAEADLNHVVKAAVAQLAKKVQASGADIQIDPMPTVRCDSSQLTLLFQSLIDNAVKFTAQNVQPIVKVSVKEEANRYIFSIKDNGIGIEAKFHDRIFAIFQRLHPRNEYEGTGVGLAVCKKIVERHGGKIWVESEPEKGSVFYFTLKK